jgi:hypothetical protein
MMVRRISYAAVFAMLTSLAACTVGPDYTPP